MNCDHPSVKLTPVDDALELLIQRAPRLTGIEPVPTIDALGRVLAETLISTINVPPADNSAMDGYAVNSADLTDENIQRLPISQRIPAGEIGEQLTPGTVARIFTGAPIPPGADAVVMQELVELDGDDAFITGPVKSGKNVRSAGEDIATGDAILQSGTKLRPQELGLAASVGLPELPVFRRLKVAVFFTGDELREPGSELKSGQIYNSNRYSLTSLLRTLGCEVIDLGIISDDLAATRTALKQAAEKADLVMTSGGVSVGEEDYVRIALDELGKLEMWRLAIKPGKPLAFGEVSGTPFLGLPGNPVSVFVTFCILARPFILAMQGITDVHAASFQMPANFTWSKAGIRREYLRARMGSDANGSVSLSLYPHQGSGVLTSTSWADGLVILRENTTVQPGDLVDFLPFSELST